MDISYILIALAIIAVWYFVRRSRGQKERTVAKDILFNKRKGSSEYGFSYGASPGELALAKAKSEFHTTEAKALDGYHRERNSAIVNVLRDYMQAKGLGEGLCPYSIRFGEITDYKNPKYGLFWWLATDAGYSAALVQVYSPNSYKNGNVELYVNYNMSEARNLEVRLAEASGSIWDNDKLKNSDEIERSADSFLRWSFV